MNFYIRKEKIEKKESSENEFFARNVLKELFSCSFNERTEKLRTNNRKSMYESVIHLIFTQTIKYT